MFRLFRYKKKETMPMEFPVHNYSDISNINYEQLVRPIESSDSKITRLMELIGCAIEDWAVEYHMENLPKDIVFQQAFDAMQSIEQIMKRK